MDILKFIAALAGAYLLGSICTAAIVSNRVMKKDIRELGSGNPGFANSLRVMGKGWAVVVFAVDCLKGVAAVLLAEAIWPEHPYLYLLAGICALLGHAYPLFFGFKGGKGISTMAGIALVTDWRVALIAIGIYVIIVLTTRVSSLGSIIAACSVPVLTAIFHHAPGSWDYILIAGTAVMALMLVLWHRGNIARLIKGDEKKI
ncbi:glycerol-3-phosphate acyltransferase 2 [Clostridia bacterium]|nr:glycerol-3-phosphate acyltransferase 2 [Clostridia bacterium]